jgi:hypothetical protein
VGNFSKFLSTAPVIAMLWIIITSVILIVANYYFPDRLVFSL